MSGVGLWDGVGAGVGAEGTEGCSGAEGIGAGAGGDTLGAAALRVRAAASAARRISWAVGSFGTGVRDFGAVGRLAAPFLETALEPDFFGLGAIFRILSRWD